jgi:hypothetical protein
MEELLAAGIIGHHEEEEFQERFGGKKKGPFSLFIFRMMLEGFMRGFKGGVTVATSEVLKKGFNPKGAVS